MREINFFLVDYESENTHVPHPIYANGFSIVAERESGQVFFREKLSDKLTFVAEDFAWIMAQDFDAVINLIMQIKDNGVLVKTWQGKFTRTDCTINEVDGILTVTPSTHDEYDGILTALDNEVDLAQLPIVNTLAIINVPPVLQIYKPGDTFITNYWQGEAWETEVEPKLHLEDLEPLGFRFFAHFPSTSDAVFARVLRSTSGSVEAADDYNINLDAYKYAQLIDFQTLNITLVGDLSTVSSEPTKYGKKYVGGQDTGYYYAYPRFDGYVCIPYSRRNWASHSYWIRVLTSAATDIDDATQILGVQASYEIGDLIRALCSANDIDVSFADTAQCSHILYGSPSPMAEWTAGWRLYFTAKSNVVKLGAGSPATKVPCSLNTVFTFLRKALNIAWSIEGSYLKLEHISYYKNGGSYQYAAEIGEDLTRIINTRNGKPWAFGQNEYSFEKYQMPEFVKWAWMDESDQLFDGSGFKCLSNYVNKGRTEDNNVSNITTNIAKMIMQPDKFSLDGLAVILTAANDRTIYYYFTREIGGNWRVPNGQLSMWNLQQGLLLYEAPCEIIEVSGIIHNNVDCVRTKTNEVTYPANDADPQKLIKTNVGVGAVDTLTINIVNQSIKAKLKYGNE